MKDKILMLIIGVLLGSVITAGCFLIFGNKSSNNAQPEFGGRGGQTQMGNFTPGEMPDKLGNRIAPSQTETANTTSNT